MVEGKIVGLVEIVTDIAHNRELVQDGHDDIVITCDSRKALLDAIEYYDLNWVQLYLAKQNSLKSARRYDVKNYMEEVVKELETK